MEREPEYIVEAMDLLTGITEPRQVIQEISGFVPVFDMLLKKYQDPLTALVFGRRWQYCRMSDGVCRASLETIADDLSISKATVMRHTEKLVEDGFLIDLTPEIRNAPHIYADAGLIVMKNQLSTTVSERNATVSQRNATVSQSHLIKQYRQSKRQTIKGATPPKEPKPAEPKATEYPELVVFKELTGRWPNRLVWGKVIERIKKVSHRLSRPVTKDELLPFFTAWLERSNNVFNLTWLEWAEVGTVPQNGWRQNANSKNIGQSNEYSEADRAAAERIRARKQMP